MSIPNLLSLLRLVLVPVFAVVFFQPAPDAHRWAVLIYLTAFLTDVADGWIARHFNQITKLGRILDPLADKLMTFTVIICITADGIISDDELEDFIRIREELERISIAVETLQLWSERMLATGAINAEQYEAYERRRAAKD